METTAAAVGLMGNATSGQNPFFVDYTILDCFKHHNPGECAASSTMGAITLITLVAAFVEAIVVVKRTGSVVSWKSLVMFALVAELVMLLVRIAFVAASQLTVFIMFVELNVLLFITYFFSVYALRILKRIRLIRPVLYPVIAAVEVAMVALLILELFNNHSRFLDTNLCFDFSWTSFTIVQCLLGVVLLISVFITTSKTRAKTSNAQRSKKKRYTLIGVVFTCMTSGILALAMQLAILFAFLSIHDCSTFFANNQIADTMINFIMYFLNFALPIWSLLVLFNSLSSRTNTHVLRHEAVDKGKPLPPEVRPLLMFTASQQDLLSVDVSTNAGSRMVPVTAVEPGGVTPPTHSESSPESFSL